jgi:hypothetical protein
MEMLTNIFSEKINNFVFFCFFHLGTADGGGVPAGRDGRDPQRRSGELARGRVAAAAEWVTGGKQERRGEVRV